jgi:hypothetical protein
MVQSPAAAEYADAEYAEGVVVEETPLPEGYEQRFSNSKQVRWGERRPYGFLALPSTQSLVTIHSACRCPSQANYYVNLATGETSWVRPV